MSLSTRSNQYGKILGDWTIRKKIATGSQGTVVYQIVRKNMGGEDVCALKAIPIISERGNYNSLPDHRKTDYRKALLERATHAEHEVQNMIKLRGRTNIVDYFDHGVVEWEDENEFGCDLLIRMELLCDLRSELKGRIFSEADAIHIGKDICSALVVCHSKGILHRDIKPENIFFNEDGDYKLGDFGIARILDRCPGSHASTGVGTPEYSAPEQVEGKYDMKVDIYSLGLVLYELENRNRLPFAESSYVGHDEIKKRLNEKVLPFPCDASPELAKVIIKACAHSPEDRFQTAEEMLNALNRIDSTTPIIPRPVSDPSRAIDLTSAGNGYDTEMALPDSTDLPPARRGYETEKARPDSANANSVQNSAAADHTPIHAVGSISHSEDFIIENGVLVKYRGQDKDVVLPTSITKIGDSAFKDCSGLTSITIPNSVTSIGIFAFIGCSGLTSVTIPNSVTSIEDSAFCDCSGLTSVTIPNSVTSIRRGAFCYCNHLTSINVANGNPKYVSFDGVLFNANQSVLHTYPSGKLNASYCVPSSVTRIEYCAFEGCNGLTSVTIPNSVTSIGVNAFEGCTALMNIYYSGSEEQWKQIKISKNGNKSLTSATIHFNITGKSCTIENQASKQVVGCISHSEDFIILNGVLLRYRGQDKDVVLPTSITSIGNRAFFDCRGLTRVVIHNSVTSIGDYAFSGCFRLTSVTFPNSVTSIGDFAFAGCDALKNIYYGGSEEQWKQIEINEKENQSLTSATIHYNVTGKSSVAVNHASGQADGSISPRTASLAHGFFDDLARAIREELDSEECASSDAIEKDATKDFVIENGSLVKYCGQDKDVVLPSSVTKIEKYAFYNCVGLTSVTIPNSVTFIEYFAFLGCDTLKNIYYSGSEKQWEQIGGNKLRTGVIIHYYYNVAEPEKSAAKKPDDDLDDPYEEIFQIFNKGK